MSVSVPTRRDGESDLDYLRRKEISWGLWQADALERIEQQEQEIEALRQGSAALLAVLSTLKSAVDAMSPYISANIEALRPIEMASDTAPFINIMSSLYKVDPYVKAKRTRKAAQAKAQEGGA